MRAGVLPAVTGQKSEKRGPSLKRSGIFWNLGKIASFPFRQNLGISMNAAVEGGATIRLFQMSQEPFRAGLNRCFAP